MAQNEKIIELVGLDSSIDDIIERLQSLKAEGYTHAYTFLLDADSCEFIAYKPNTKEIKDKIIPCEITYVPQIDSDRLIH